MACCPISPSEANTTITQINIQASIYALQLQQMYVAASLNVYAAFLNVPLNFDSDPGDVGPEIAQRDLALCLATSLLVDELFTGAMLSLRGSVPEATAVAFGAAGVAATFSGPAYPIVMGAFLFAGLLAAEIYQELARRSYRDYISCTIYDNLQGVASGSESGFATSLDVFPFPRPLPETIAQDLARDIIETWVRSQLDNLNIFLVFVEAMDAANRAAGVTEVPCPCDLGWSHTFDFTIDEQGWTDRTEDNRPFGLYSPGVGWVSEFAGAEIGQPNAERLYIQIADFDPRVVNGIEVFYTTVGVEGAGRQATLQVVLADVILDTSINVLWSVPSVFTHAWAPNNMSDEIQQTIVNPTGADNSDITITKIIAQGVGTDPFP